MVQSVSNQVSADFGTLNKVGTTQNGRVVYQIASPDAKESVKVSVAAQDCDVFEKSYQSIIDVTPKLQEFAEKTSPEKMQRKQKIAKWLVPISGLLVALPIALKTKVNSFGTGLKAAGLTTLGLIGGLAGGLFISSKIVTPPGAKEFSRATQALSKLDIQPVQD